MLVLTTSKGADIGHLAFAPDGASLAASAPEIGIELWNVVTGRGQSRPLNGLAAGDFCFHPSGRWLFAPAPGGGLAAHDLTTGEVHTAPLGGAAVIRIRASPDGKTLVCSRFERSTFHSSGYASLGWKADGTFAPGWSVRTFDNASGRNVTGWCCGVAVLSDGERFATAEYEIHDWPRITVRSLATGKVLRSYPIHGAASPVLAVAPDDSLLVAAVKTVLSVFAESDASKPLRRVRKAGRKHFTGVAFHPSGQYLAATSNDTTVKLYDTATWQLAKTFSWDVGRLRSVAFSPDGTRAAVGSDTGKVVVWDVDE